MIDRLSKDRDKKRTCGDIISDQKNRWFIEKSDTFNLLQKLQQLLAKQHLTSDLKDPIDLNYKVDKFLDKMKLWKFLDSDGMLTNTKLCFKITFHSQRRAFVPNSYLACMIFVNLKSSHSQDYDF